MNTYTHHDNPSVELALDEAELSGRLYRAAGASAVPGEIRFALAVETEPVVDGHPLAELLDVAVADALNPGEFEDWKALTRKIRDWALAQKFDRL